MKTKHQSSTTRRGYTVARLAEMLGADARILKTFLCLWKPVTQSPRGPLYTKADAVSALLLRRRNGKSPSTLEFMRRVFYAGVRLPMRGDCTRPADALARYDLAQWRGVSPDEVQESID